MLALQASTSLNLPATAQEIKSGNHVVRITRVRGWEAQLVAGDPNLANFYWEPMTRKTILTTKKTGRQTNHIPLPTRTILMKSPPNHIRQTTFTSIAYQSSAGEKSTALPPPLVYKQNDAPDTLSKLNVAAQLAHPTSSHHAAGLVAHAQLLKLSDQ